MSISSIGRGKSGALGNLFNAHASLVPNPAAIAAATLALAAVLAPLAAPPPANAGQIDYSSITEAAISTQDLETPTGSIDFSTFHLREAITKAVVDDIDRVRKEMGLPKLEDAARAKKEGGSREPEYVDTDKIMEAVRIVSKGHSATDKKRQDGSSGPG